jgi:uncharacterized protein (TIGR00297 family)
MHIYIILQIIMRFIIPLIIFVVILCIKTKKLTVPASLTAGLIAFLIFLGTGYTGIAMLGSFFVMGILATSHKKQQKAVIGEHQQERKTGQVLANGGAAAIVATLAIFDPAHAGIYTIMLAGSLASATADTLSSELGMVYGRNFYNVLTFRREPKGLDGVISQEGTLLGALGAMIIAAIYVVAYGMDRNAIVIVMAGVLGNLIDSVLGAALERKHYINNDTVNFLNTGFASLISLLLYYFISN